MKRPFLLLLFLPFFLAIPAFASNGLSLNQKEISDLTSPSVVKIIQKVKGDAEIPAFKINFSDLTVSIDDNQPSTTVPVDDYFFGSGFVVNPDGYIMTNSHVVSYQTVKNLIASDFILPAISEGFNNLSEAETAKIGEKSDEIAKFGEKIVNYVLENSKFNIEKEVVVLNPSSKKENTQDLFNEGFPAKIISVNDDFYKDNKDTAIIKIDEKNLPAILLGSSVNISTGDKVYILGYPTTAELNSKGLVSSSFTQGIVSALKDSITREFKVIETDAKISKGSSGGPLLNEQGGAIGLVTFITNDETKQDGDSFAFAVPIDVAKKTIREKIVQSETLPDLAEGGYGRHFLLGLDELHQNHCQKALQEFDLARQVNSKFNVAKYLDPYVNECNVLIQSGKSIDTPLGMFWQKITTASYLVWIGVTVVFLVFLWGLIYIIRLRFRVNKDEKELDNVERYLHLNLEDGNPIDEKGKEEDELERLKPKVKG